MSIFTASIMESFVTKALELEHEKQDAHQLLADMCNQMCKLVKPLGCSFNQAQAEFIRDLMADEYVDLLIHTAVQDKLKTLPAYAGDLGDPATIQANAEIRQRLMLFDLVLGDITGLKPEVDLKAFTKVDTDPVTGLFGLAIAPDRHMRYKAQMVREFTELPVLVQNERVVN